MNQYKPATLCKQCNKPYSAHLINGRYGVRHIFMPIDDKVLEKYDALEGADADDFCPHCGAHCPRGPEERAAVVKYLRDHAFDLYNIAAKDEVYELAGAIERGEHHESR